MCCHFNMVIKTDTEYKFIYFLIIGSSRCVNSMRTNLFVTLALLLGTSPMAAQLNFSVDRHVELDEAVLQKAHFVRNESYQVVRVTELPNGVRIEYRKNSGGGVYKTLVNPNATGGFHTVPTFKAPATEQMTFYENFSGWDGVSNNWLPEGWTRTMSDERFETMEDGNFAWHVGTKRNNLPTAVDGNNYAIIYYAYEGEGKETINLPQDEWMYTPYFTPKPGDVFSCYLGYSAFFLFDTTSGNVDWNNNDFLVRKSSHNMYVLIREEGSEQWVELMNLFDEWKDAEFKELMNNHFSSQFKKYEFSLHKYVGKKVQVAFRYKGIYGNTMEVDAVQVASGNRIEADYQRPQGAFHWGLSENFASVKDRDGKSLLLVPAYEKLTWRNTSNQGETFTWTYSDPAQPNKLDQLLTSNEKDLEVTYPYGLFSVPSLKVESEGLNPASYQIPAIGMQAGGMSYYSDGMGGVMLLGVGNYNLANRYMSLCSDQDAYLFGKSDNTANAWKGLYAKETKLVGIANRFEKPQIPYSLSEVMVHGIGTVAPNAELKLTIFRMDGENVTSDVLATASCKGSDVITVNADNKNFLTIPFVMNSLIVKDGILMVLSGLEPDGTSNFGVLHSSLPAEHNECNGYFLVNVDGTEVMEPLSILESNKGVMYSSFLFGMNAGYAWITCDEDHYYVNKAGGSHTFHTTSYFDASSLSVSVAYDDMNGGDWAHCSLNNNDLTVKVDALESGVEERTCRVLLSSYGTVKTFYIKQNETGSSIDELNDVKNAVWAEGESFVVESAQNFVEVFSSNGVKLGLFWLQNGQTVIPAAGWQKGLYVFRFSDNTQIKVMK